MARNTKPRLMSIARDLFNARGFGNVTIAQIAAAADISEGNLWYHFPDKRSLLEALSAELMADLDVRLCLGPEPDVSPIDAYADFLAALCLEMDTHLFLYRDNADYGAHSDAFENRLGEIYARTIAQITSYIAEMTSAGHITLSTEHHEPMAKTMTLILRYYPEYVREDPSESGTDPVMGAIEQHLVPLAPFMAATVRDQLLLKTHHRLENSLLALTA